MNFLDAVTAAVLASLKQATRVGFQAGIAIGQNRAKGSELCATVLPLSATAMPLFWSCWRCPHTAMVVQAASDYNTTITRWFRAMARVRIRFRIWVRVDWG